MGCMWVLLCRVWECVNVHEGVRRWARSSGKGLQLLPSAPAVYHSIKHSRIQTWTYTHPHTHVHLHRCTVTYNKMCDSSGSTQNTACHNQQDKNLQNSSLILKTKSTCGAIYFVPEGMLFNIKLLLHVPLCSLAYCAIISWFLVTIMVQ